MFKAKKLDKLVQAGIISSKQKAEILEFDDTAGAGFVMKALSLLGIFTIGMGVISLVASNWDAISDSVKLITMFALLFGTAGGVVYYQQKGFSEKAEKLLVMLFLLVGAAIGLVIQIYHLSGNIKHLPFAFWWMATLPLLFVAKKKYVAYFWVPLFLVWCAMYTGGYHWLEVLLIIYAIVSCGGWALCKFIPRFAIGCVLQRDAFFAFYLVLAIYIWNHLLISAGILVLTSFLYQYYKDYRKVRLNIKFIGLWVFSAYLYLGDKIGLFSTGIGMILSGVVFILLLKGVAQLMARIKMENKNA
ncbi:MAG: DUF2157 domain-containing protein [Acetobacter sp.]|nr:DUF2157 domain-containing protein [Acetobacter sp.]